MTHGNIGFYWERRRLAGFAFRLNAAAIPNPSRRDAGAPSVIFGTVYNITISPGFLDSWFTPVLFFLAICVIFLKKNR
jgi:hypothetical protein